MKTKNYCIKCLSVIFFMTLMLSCTTVLKAQEVTTYQYRLVAPENVDEFIKRETTYWSNVARKAIDKGTLTFWGLFQKVGGTDVQNSSNFLFINTYKDIDANMNDVWNATALYPKIAMAQMETNSISKVTANIYFGNPGWQQAGKATPAKDFNYVVMNYHNSSNPSQFVEIEKNQWGPFIKSAMDNNQTKQVAWGNSIVLTPGGGDMKFNCISYDLFPTLKSALMQSWNPDTKFPTTGLDSLQKISLNPAATVIYRVVKVESKN